MMKKLLAALGIVIILTGVVIYWCYRNVVVSVPVTERVVALTFDDGPNPPHTQALLDLLRQHGVRATFFLKGRNVEAFPEAVRAIALAGHEIGNHSYSHRLMFATSKAGAREELLRTNLRIADLLGYQPLLFRPPFGAQGPGLHLALGELGMTSILMSSHGADWRETDPAQIASAVLESIAPGSIVLLHDGHGDVDDPGAQDSRAASVAATGLIIEQLQARGYRFATVGELMRMSEG